MNTSAILISFRHYHNREPEQLAEELEMSPDNYHALESGKTELNEFTGQKLANLYKVPLELFYSVHIPAGHQHGITYNNCTFHAGHGGSSGYINHQYNDRGIDEILYAKKEEIETLKQQLALLQEQNNRLIELLLAR